MPKFVVMFLHKMAIVGGISNVPTDPNIILLELWLYILITLYMYIGISHLYSIYVPLIFIYVRAFFGPKRISVQVPLSSPLGAPKRSSGPLLCRTA